MNNKSFDNESVDTDAGVKSKTQAKKEVTALQHLGERLTELNSAQLNLVPINDDLRAAIDAYQGIKQHGAKRRQLQYIGRLMRSADAQAISAALDHFDASKIAFTRHFHGVEQWRERLLEDPAAATEFINQYPNTRIQQLRETIRKAHKEKVQAKDQGGSRKLFRFLRETIEEHELGK